MAAYESIGGGGVTTRENAALDFLEGVTREKISKNPVETYENLLLLAAGDFRLMMLKKMHFLLLKRWIS